MLLIDDLLTAPFRSLFWIFQEVHRAVLEESQQQKDDITQQLAELYMLLETGQITEQAFDEQEAVLLELLEKHDE
jgi:hypothetical protein